MAERCHLTREKRGVDADPFAGGPELDVIRYDSYSTESSPSAWTVDDSPHQRNATATRTYNQGATTMPPPNALGTFDLSGHQFPGVVVEERVLDVTTLLPSVRTTGDLLLEWDAQLDQLIRKLDDLGDAATAASTPVSELRVLPPVQPVGQTFAAGANYRQHVLEITVAHGLGRPGASDGELRDQAAEARQPSRCRMSR